MQPHAVGVEIRWGVKIPLRDGLHLQGTLYLPEERTQPAPVILTLTPYISQFFHDRGLYFASRGFPFMAVDVRGRGNSDGTEFRPFVHDAQDGADVIEWLAREDYCDGQVAMWGGSYGGFNQWAAATERPPSLKTMVPVSAIGIGLDFPMRNNITFPYVMQWLTFVSGRTLQDNLFRGNEAWWADRFRRVFESGAPFRALDSDVGNPSQVFQEWIDHPTRDEYWDRFSPTADVYRSLAMPVLTITGVYDNAQIGALTYYREHLKSAGDSVPHYLVIGPWDHGSTRRPQREFAGLGFGEASVVDLEKLHLDWYTWTMRGGEKPEFLKDKVAYYVTGAERWRCAGTLQSVTSEIRPLYLTSEADSSRLYPSGLLTPENGADCVGEYVYDPSDLSISSVESSIVQTVCLRPQFFTDSLTDQRVVLAKEGKQLIYHSAPFESDTEVSGFFQVRLWISIDQPDTDFLISIYEIGPDGSSILLTVDCQRARYRESLYKEALITDPIPLLYNFDSFTFVSRLLKRGSRIRMVLGPIDTIYTQKNYNSGTPVSMQSAREGVPVTVRVFQGQSHPSVVIVPMGRPPERDLTGTDPYFRAI
jgi:uncharacterized protein